MEPKLRFQQVAISPTSLMVVLSLTLIGCAANKNPSTSPDKANVNAYLLVPGCDGGKKIKDVPGPLKDYREKMSIRYRRFMDSDGHKGEKKILEQCGSIEAIDRFFEQFWGSLRDPDASTPVNEYKETVDRRIEDIENEVLLGDGDIAGTFFSANGGLKGDMAHVYLLRDMPHYKVRIHNMSRVVDLMAWVYFDPSQRPLFVFIFYDKGQGHQLFRNHMVMNNVESYTQVLRDIARIYPTSVEDYAEIERELVYNDKEYIFQFGLQRFSYDESIKLDKVLAPPTPEAITAKAIQPKILGVPNIPKDMKLVFSPYHATVTGFFTLNKYPDGTYISRLTLRFFDIDWEKKSETQNDGIVKEVYESKFDVAVNFTNEKTRDKKEFYFAMTLNTFPEKYEKNREYYFPVDLNELTKHSSGKDGKMSIPEIIKTLEPGDYEIKMYLLNQVTMKSGIWYQYITVSK